MTEKVIPGHSMQNLQQCSFRQARGIELIEVLRMKDKRGQGSVLLFYIMVISLVLFGTILGNQTVATISEMIPVERLHRIVIDAGHGGEDGGAISCSGRNESNYNLSKQVRPAVTWPAPHFRMFLRRKPVHHCIFPPGKYFDGCSAAERYWFCLQF